MAPKKRKHTAHARGAAPANPVRVKCPACQKEVPSFFVNSHLDLECLVLKSGALPGRPASSPSAWPNSGCNTPSLDGQFQGATSQLEEIISKPSVEGENTPSSLSLKFDKGKSGDDVTDEGIPKGIAALRECASYDEDDDDGVGIEDCACDVQPERAINPSVSFTGNELENDGRQGNFFGKTHSEIPRLLLPNLSCQSIHQRKYKEDEASGWLCKPGHFAIPGSFLSLPPLKVTAPKGLQVLENFITAEEEEHVLHCLDTDISNPWKLSRVNGIHQGKAYGNHIYGDSKRRVVSQVYAAMPNFILPYVERMRDQVSALKDFFPNEMNSIDYRKGDGHYLKAHMDDRQLSGKILVNLSLAGSCFMTYTRELGIKETFRVELSPRSLQVLTGESRYNYTHGIQKNDIMDSRRVSMTFRQSVETSQSTHSGRQR